MIIVALAVSVLVIYGITDFLTDPQRQDYSLEQIDYQVVLAEDGRGEVMETRTFQFNRGSYTFAWFELDKTAQNVEVLENGQPYSRLDDLSASERPEGYYAVADQGSFYRVEWYYRAQAPQTRHFQIRYEIPQAAIAYSDAVVYFQKYLSETNTTKIGKVTASIFLPDGADASNTLIWGHGPGYGQIFFAEDNPQRVDLEIIKPALNQYVEARFLMPAASLSNPAVFEDRPIYDQVYQEEMEAAKQANRQLWLSRIFFALAVIAVLALIFLTLLLRQKHRQAFTRYQAAAKPPFYREIPANVPPAIAAKLHQYYKTEHKTADLISISILDLIYRQVLLVTAQPDGRKMETWLQLAAAPQGKHDLLEYEQPIIDFLFRDVGQLQPTISLSQLNKYCKRQKNLSAIQSLVSQFEASFNILWSDYRYMETKKNTVPALIMVLRIASLGLGLLGLGFIFGLVALPLGGAGIVLAIGGTIAFLLNLILCHKRKMLTQKGEDELALWQALERFFNEFSTFDEKELPEIGFWEKLLVYAAALKVADRVMQQLQMRYPQLNDSHYLYGHYYYMYSFSQIGPTVGSGFSTFQSSLSSAMRDAQTVISRHQASSGSGGGFSGGGSSGGGGAGGSSGGGAG